MSKKMKEDLKAEVKEVSTKNPNVDLYGITFDKEGRPKVDDFITRTNEWLEVGLDYGVNQWLSRAPVAGPIAKAAYTEAKKHGFKWLPEPPSSQDLTIHYPPSPEQQRFAQDLAYFQSLPISQFPYLPELSTEKKKEDVCQTFVKIGISETEVTTIVDSALQKADLDHLHQGVNQLVSWEKQKMTAEKQRQQFHGLAQFSDFMFQLGAHTKCEPLQKFAAASKAVIAGVQAGVELASAIAKGAGAGAMLGPIGMLGGAVLSLIGSLMSSGPDPNQIILKQLNKLSEQLSNLHDSMNQHFKDAYKLQKGILETVIHGFEKVNQQLQALYEQGGSLRAEVQENFAKIEATLKLMLVLFQQNSEILVLKDLTDICAQADNWLQGHFDGDPEQRVPQLCNRLANWATVHANNKLLTGIGFYEAKPDPHDAAHFLADHSNENTLNSFLGYFAAYAKTTRQKYIASLPNLPQPIAALSFNPDKVLNPYIWLRAVNQYTRFKKEFIPLDNDPYNEQCDSIMQAGETVPGFIEELANDPYFWDSLLKHCQDIVSKIYDLIADYKKAYSEHHINSKTNPRSDIIKEFNFFADPMELIKCFQECTLTKIQGDEIEVSAKLKELNLNLKNLTPVFETLKNRSCLPVEFLCAQYLLENSIQFQATQSKGISGYDFSQKDDRMVNLPDNEISPSSQKMTYHWDGKISLTSGDTPNKKGHSKLYFNRTVKGVKGLSWGLSAQLSYTLGGSQRTHLVELHFHGQWEGISFDLNNKQDWGRTTGTGKSGNPNHFQWRLTDDTLKEYINSLHRHVANYWNSPPKDQPITFWSAIPSASISSETNSVRKAIDHFYMKHRQTIANNLHQCQDQTSDGQKKLNQLKNLFEALSLSIIFLKWYASLVGKDISNIESTLQLITPDRIKTQLSKYAHSNTVDLKDELIPEAWLKHTQALNFKDIQALAASKKLPALHPKNLILAGKARLQSYQLWKILFKKNFPTFSSYVNLQTYQSERQIWRSQFFQEEVYQWFETLFGKSFRKAKLWTHQNTLLIPNADEYRKHYQTIYAWTVEQSREGAVTGFLPSIQHKKKLQDIENLATQQLLSLKLTRGWERNVWLLMHVAQALGNCQFQLRRPIVNFMMWREGIIALLRMISNPAFAEAEQQAGIQITHHHQALQASLEAGRELKQVIHTIAQSKQLFAHLFDGYLNDALGQLKNFIGLKFEENSTNPSPNIAVYEKLNNAIYRGSNEKLLDLLETYFICIQAYYHMIFASGFDHGSGFKLMGKEELLEYLYAKEETQYHPSLLARVTNYCQGVEAFFNAIQGRVRHLTHVVAFQHELETYFMKQGLTDCLVIDGAKWQGNLSLEHIQLLDEFLLMTGQDALITKKAPAYISKITFKNVDLCDEKILMALMQTLSKYPQWQEISFCQVKLSPASLSLLKDALPQWPALIALNFSHNNLGSQGLEIVFALSELLQALPRLQQMALSNNQLDHQGYCAVAAALTNHHQLILLDLSGNPMTQREPALLGIATLLQDHPQLLELSLANIGLKASDLRELVPAVGASVLQRLHLSSNHFSDQTEDLWYLIDFLQALQKIKTIHLAGMSLGNNSLYALATLLTEKPQIEQINLSGNAINAQGTREIETTLPDLLPKVMLVEQNFTQAIITPFRHFSLTIPAQLDFQFGPKDLSYLLQTLTLVRSNLQHQLTQSREEAAWVKELSSGTGRKSLHAKQKLITDFYKPKKNSNLLLLALPQQQEETKYVTMENK